MQPELEEIYFENLKEYTIHQLKVELDRQYHYIQYELDNNLNADSEDDDFELF